MTAVLAGLSSSTPLPILSGQATRRNVSLKSLGERETGGSLGTSHWSSLPFGESAVPVVALALQQHSGPDIQERRLTSQATWLVSHSTANLGRCADVDGRCPVSGGCCGLCCYVGISALLYTWMRVKVLGLDECELFCPHPL